MDKAKRILTEVHLYTNKIEALIKILIWIISWIGGIVVLLGTEDKGVLGSAYFIYTLSLLMEFTPKIWGKTEFISKLVHTSFCFLIAAVCILSVSILLGVSLNEKVYKLMFILIIIIIVYMIIDTFLLWLSVDINISIRYTNEEKADMNIPETCFEQKLHKGNLGNLMEEN